jgi:AmmeMemoRadiSam system protein B
MEDIMARIRAAAVAGMFYPGDAPTLRQMVQDFLAHTDSSGAPPRALIAPHAGYIYSGPVAASVYHLLEGSRERIKRIVLLGPSHRVPLLGLAATDADFFSTPLGDIPIDRETIDKLLQLPQVKLMEQAHLLEHSLEVQLPFLQTVLKEFKLVPLVVGDASAEEVCEVLETVYGDDETLIVISSDLSHYYDYETSRKMDRHTSQAIERLHPEEIEYEDACGRNGIKGLLLLARKKGLHAETVDLRNSGDTAGPKDEVVGYGAYAFR